MRQKIFIAFFFVLLLVGTISAFDWTDGLPAYYKFDETSGNATDATGVNNATETTATQNGVGIIDKAYIFNGSTLLYVNLTNISIVNNVSINYWVYANASGPNMVAIDKIKTAAITPYRSGLSGGKAYFSSGNDTDIYTATATANLSVGWHMITGIYNGSRTALYIDGVANATVSMLGTLYQSPEKVMIGKTTNNAFGFSGKIDEMGIWNRTLSASEITELYNSGAGFP